MDPLHFPEQNNVLARSQSEYRVLPVFILEITTEAEKLNLNPKRSFQFTCKYQLSELEIAQIIETKTLFFSQFGSCFHPILPTVQSQFGTCTVLYKSLGDGFYNFSIAMQDGTHLVLNGVNEILAVDTILQHVTNITAEQILFVEQPGMGVDETGEIKEL